VKRATFAIFVILGSMAASADAKPLPAIQHQPAVVLNLPSVWINLGSFDVSGYKVNASLLVSGATSASDRLRFEWKSGGKVVGVGKCQSQYDEKSKTLNGTCGIEDNIKAKGPIQIDVIYTDDQEDKDYLVTTLKTDVKNWKGIGKAEYWGIVPDDLLSVAFVYFANERSVFHRPLFQFWSTANLLGREPTFRCSVDGKKLPDFTAHIDNPHGPGSGYSEIESSFTNPKEHRTYSFRHFEIDPGFHFGRKDDFGGNDASQVRWAIDSPGKWDCFLRIDGKSVRELLFTVNDQGMIEQSEMQKGAHMVPMVPSLALVDMKIPHNNGFELRIRPEAMKKSIGFGFPWPDGPSVKEIQASFPPASGLSD
jgi:hypothetical protein